MRLGWRREQKKHNERKTWDETTGWIKHMMKTDMDYNINTKDYE